MDADRNLLFGVLALQVDLINHGQFVEACAAWTARKEGTLADLLVERGWLTATDRSDVERLLQRKLKKHGGDSSSVLAEVADPEVKRSISSLGAAGIQLPPAEMEPAPSPYSTVSEIQVPSSRARYTLTVLHAVGGIGRVWLARETELGRSVALKDLRPERADSPTDRARFLREAQITGQLEHPGILPIYELSRRPDNQRPFYTMRFVKGQTLSQAVRKYHQNLDTDHADSLAFLALLNAFVVVCNTVAYAHSRGVIHRDLKGQNILLGDFGEVVLLDWGLAKLVDRPVENLELPPIQLEEESPDIGALTMQGQLVGTPSYMAPEQAEGRLDLLDRRTDVYGLGAILYEILTGQPPFIGSDINEVLRRVREEEPLPPCQLRAMVPPALEAACLRALAKLPDHRYGSATELAQEVQNWQEVQRRKAEEALKQTNEELARSNEQLRKLAAELEEKAGSERRVHQQLIETQQHQLKQAEEFARLGRMVLGVSYEIEDSISWVSKAVILLQGDFQAICNLVNLYHEAEKTLAEHQPGIYRGICQIAEQIDLPCLPSRLELLSQSRNSLASLRQIVKDLSSSAELHVSGLQEVNLNAAIEPAINITRVRANKKGVHLEVDLAQLPLITCFSAEINRVVLNLLNNAIDACPKGKKITLRSCSEPAGVAIQVIDTGTGIDPSILDKIFEPHFSPKPPGRGRGLGLSLSSLIVEKHGGRIEVESRVGHGTHFTVRLPLTPPESARG
jgi:signal transduction histidine kinase/tRNA A-37 threonylcarbamoyl transferase component Bud32